MGKIFIEVDTTKKKSILEALEILTKFSGVSLKKAKKDDPQDDGGFEDFPSDDFSQDDGSFDSGFGAEETPKIELKDIQSAFRDYAGINGNAKALAVLKKFKVKNVQSLKEDDYSKVLKIIG